MIEFRSVSYIYPNGVRALSGINVFIDKGEFVFLVGPTSSGKSTFLRLIYKEIVPTYGEVLVDGKSIKNIKPRQVPFLRRKIGVVFQDFKLLQNRTIHENIAYAMEVIGASRFEISRRIPRILNLVGIGDKAHLYPDELSGGEQQRASIARALINQPLILLADEPTGNLDPDTAWDLMQTFQKINLKGTTIVVATHNRTIVDRMRKRVLVILEGHLVEDKEKGVYSYGFQNSIFLPP